MVSNELLDYIRERQKQGANSEKIKNELRGAGWSEEAIRGAFEPRTMPIPRSTPGPYPTANSLPGASALINSSWNIYKSKIRLIIGIFIFPVIMSLATSLISEAQKSISEGAATNSFLPLLSITNFFFTIIGFFITVWANLALIYAIHKSDPVSPKEAFHETRNIILSSWWINILIVVISLGGYVLFIIPGILFSYWFSLSVFVLVVEGIKGMDALMQSRQYAKGHVLSLLWRTFALGLLNLAIGIAAFAVPAIVLAILNLKTVISIYTVLAAVAFSFFSVPFATIYGYLMYTSLKETKGVIPSAPNRSRGLFIAIGIIGPIAFAILAGFILYNVASSIKKFGNGDFWKQIEIEYKKKNGQELNTNGNYKNIRNMLENFNNNNQNYD